MSSEDVGEQLSTSPASKLRTREDGSLNVMASIGGVRGLAEASLPAALFAAGRLLQRGPLVQSLSGLVGVGVCAAAALTTGDGRDFYAPGFFINGVYIVAFIVSILVRWPMIGILFGLVRGEGTEWRHDVLKRRRYAAATWIITFVMAGLARGRPAGDGNAALCAGPVGVLDDHSTPTADRT